MPRPRTSCRLLFSCLALGLAVVAFECAGDHDRFERIVSEQIARYPRMEAQDLYKLALQAALGNEHLMTDSAMVRLYLEEEFDAVGAPMGEPLLEEITPDGTLVRVNLRPYKAAGLDRQRLFEAMLLSAETIQPSEQHLESYLLTILRMARAGTVPVKPGDFLPYIEQLRSEGYPAVHHSAPYEREYRPAYRVVMRSFLPEEHQP